MLGKTCPLGFPLEWVVLSLIVCVLFVLNVMWTNVRTEASGREGLAVWLAACLPGLDWTGPTENGRTDWMGGRTVIGFSELGLGERWDGMGWGEMVG